MSVERQQDGTSPYQQLPLRPPILTVLCYFTEEPAPRPAARMIQGQVKLSMIYKNDSLTVMVMHVKDLVSRTYYV